MTNKTQKIRIKDIAERAGVSTGTVDRVLHKRGEVKKDTRNKVMAILDEMGYTPNLIARSLASKKPATIAVLLPSPTDNNPYWKQPVAGINKAIDELHDFNTVVDTIHFLAADEKSFKEKAKQIIETKPSGVVFNPVFQEASREFIEELKANDIPFIFFDINILDSENIAYFGQDAFESGRTAASLLFKGLPNNANVLIVNLGNNKFISHHIKTRGNGFKDYLLNHASAKKVTTKTIAADLLNKENLKQKLDSALQALGHAEGIFVPSSRVFIVAQYLKEKDLQLPLIGYDIIAPNVEMLKDGHIQYLICQKPEAQSYKAIMAMFNHIMGAKKVDKINFSPVDIIIKENIKYYI